MLRCELTLSVSQQVQMGYFCGESDGYGYFVPITTGNFLNSGINMKCAAKIYTRELIRIIIDK
jgi:hypothetical protein